ncbi:MAG: hypothetical protein WCS79_03520 [Paludibacter sp.]
MKKPIFLVGVALIFMFAFNSCNKDTNVLDLDKTLKFTKLTVEEQKTSIEQNAIDLVNKMDGIQQTEGFVALTHLATMTINSSQPVYLVPFRQLRADLLKNDLKTLDNFTRQMRVAKNVGDSIWGEWNWNSTYGEFTLAKNLTNTAIFHFPSDSTSTSNDATLTIIYVESTIAAPDTDPVEYMPSSISVVLKVGTTEALKATFSGSYNADATPTKLSQTLTIDKYSWSADLSNDKKNVSATYEFKYDTETLLKYQLGAAGNFSESVLNDSTSRPQDIVTSGSMYFQVFNIAMLGGFKDFKAFGDEMDVIDGQKNSDKDRVTKQVAAINKYLKMYAYFVKENQKFADIEFYVVEKTETDYSNYNFNTGQYGTMTYYDIQPRLVLSDGSKQDMETFVNTGFEDLINRLNELQPMN